MWATSKDSQVQSLSLDQSTDPCRSNGGERLTWFTRSFLRYWCGAIIAAAVPEFKYPALERLA